MPPKAKVAKKKGGYQMPEKFNEGFELKDIFKTSWVLGKPIGQGGFGLIYLANKGGGRVTDDASYVVKIEPKDNGPLFCETHFYINCAKEDEIKSFARSKSLKHLAIPKYISSGLCTYNDKEYRFLVMDRYAKDLQSILNQSPSNRLNEISVLYIMKQILNSLEYIHIKGYAHGDIKGANLMLKNDSESYLVDFGLAYRFKRDNIHQKYEVKPERRHNGTIEYTSRDAHNGAQTYRRSDMEILGYCVMHWLSGTLPWIDLIKNQDQVQESKNKNMTNVKEFVRTTLNQVDSISDEVKKFMEFYLTDVSKLEFDSEPSYDKIHKKLDDTLQALGQSTSTDNFRIFSAPKSTASKPTTQKKVASSTASAIIEEDIDVSIPATRKKRQNVKETKEPEQIESNKPKTESKAKTTRAKKTTKKAINYSSEEDENDSEPESKIVKTTSLVNKKKHNKISDIEENHQDNDDDEDDSFIKENTRATKKSKKNLQSTAIDQTSDENLLKSIRTRKKLDNDVVEPKTPRAVLKQAESKKETPLKNTPQQQKSDYVKMITTSSGSKVSGLDKSPVYNQFDSDEEDQKPNTKTNSKHSDQVLPIQSAASTKYELRTTPVRNQAPKMNSAQLEILNKIKSNQDSPAVIACNSPLALSNLDKDNGFILMKKRKNVPKQTVATQTDDSYLLKLANSRKRL